MANTDNLKRLLNPEMTAKLTVKKAIDNGDPEALRTLLSQQEGKINLPIDYVLFPPPLPLPSPSPLIDSSDRLNASHVCLSGRQTKHGPPFDRTWC